MKSKPVILIVDDQPQNIELLEAYLLQKEYDLISVSNGQSALDSINDNQVDLVLLDVMMPDMDGFEVTRRIRNNPKSCQLPVILITALQEKEDRVKGIDAGCDDFISKPIDKTELLARVRSLLIVKAYNDLMINFQNDLKSEVVIKTAELSQAVEKLKTTALDTIYRLSMAAEYKDESTGNHIKRIGRYCAAIARQLNIKADIVEMLLYAAPMHDLGKIGIPDQILLKSAKLDELEWAIMKQHTVIGAEILKGSDAEFIIMAEEIARSHHEKWDGSGYPNQLKGTAIPIFLLYWRKSSQLKMNLNQLIWAII